MTGQQSLNRINRIRLEFKGGKRGRELSGVPGINRIRLEFKVSEAASGLANFGGLIESDWNLKAIVRIQNPEASIRINRIRLEFKVYSIR